MYDIQSHFNAQAAATRTDSTGCRRHPNTGSRMPEASTKIDVIAVSTWRA